MGPKIHPKSTKIASKRRSNLDPFSDLRFDRFWSRFGLQNGVQNRSFWSTEFGTANLVRNPKIWRQYYTFGRFLKVRGFENPSKIDRKTIKKRSWIRDPFRTPFWDGFRTILGSQNGGRTAGNPIFSDFEKGRFCEGYARRIPPAEPAGPRRLSAIQLVIRMIRSGLLIGFLSP